MSRNERRVPAPLHFTQRADADAVLFHTNSNCNKDLLEAIENRTEWTRRSEGRGSQRGSQFSVSPIDLARRQTLGLSPEASRLFRFLHDLNHGDSVAQRQRRRAVRDRYFRESGTMRPPRG